MKIASKLLTLLLALALVFTLLPAVARAEEVIPETKIVVEELPFQINPLYEGQITEEDLDIPETPKIDPSQVQPQGTTYLTVEEAGAQVRQHLKNREETFTVNFGYKTTNAEAAGESVLAVAMAHTGNATEGDYLKWQYGGWGGSYSRSYNSTAKQYEYSFTFKVVYYTTAEQEAELNTAVTNLINSLGVKNKSDYEKIKGVYDWICANVTYDYANLEDTTYTLKYTAYAALMDKTAVCQGYALLFYRLMLELGVDNRFIAGLAASGEAHGWNIVQLGEYYYSVDSTWDAGQTAYNYFLTSTWNFGGHYRFLEYETWEFHEEFPMAAEDYDPNVTPEIDPYLYAGTCGETAYWMLLRDGGVVVVGEGAIYDSTSRTTDLDIQWECWTGHITYVIVDEGITYIGNNAFYDEDKLEYVELSSTVTEIGEHAFYGCDVLTDLWLSEGLTTIGASAFSNCTGLLDVEFPGSLKEIGDRAFMNAGGMTAINLPEGLTTLGYAAFHGCLEVKTVYVPSSVTNIEESTFSGCTKLEFVDLHCPTVAEYMFTGCSALTDINFGSEVNTVKSHAFNDCDALTSVNYPARLGVFNGFSDCDGLVTLSIPEGITEIGEYAFEGCDNLTSVTFPRTLKRINAYAFSECTSLASLPFNEGLEYIGSHAFYSTPVKDLDFPASLTEIQGNAFGSCLGLTKVSIPKTIQTLGGFENCTNLSELVLEEGLTRISGSAFWGCKSLKQVKLPSTLTSIGRDAFRRCSNLESIEFPEGLQTIESDAFNGCNKITEVTIPKSVTSLCGFKDCDGLITVNLNNSGIVQGYAFYGCDNLQNINIGENVTEIEGSAFQKCISLKELTVPANVVDLCGFSGCDGLETVYLYNTGRIRSNAFSGCDNLKNVTISRAIGIDSSAFGGTAIAYIEIPETVKSIDYMAFGNCLKEIKFLGDCPEFDKQAFYTYSNDLVATAYYPQGNATWTEDKLQDYGGIITWVPYVPACTGHVYDAVVTEPTCTQRGYTTYTCTKCGNSYVDNYTDPMGHDYVDGVCTRCGEADPYYVKWYSGTTSLNGTIDLNMYVVLGEALVNNPDTFVRFTFENRVVEVPISEALHSPIDKYPNRYRFTCPMFAKQVADQVTVQVMNGEGPVGNAISYSVMQYCVNRIKKSNDANEVAMCKSLLNYGAAAQMFFNYNTDNLANASLSEADKTLATPDLSAHKYSITGTEEGIKAKSATVTMESAICIRVYFTLTGDKTIEDYTFTIDGREVQPRYNEKGWYIESEGIAAKRMDEMHDFCVGGITVRYSVLSYANSKLTSKDPLEVNLAKALYVYYAAAEAYLG